MENRIIHTILPKRKQAQPRPRLFCFYRYHSQFPRLAQPDKWPYSRCTPLASQASIISLDQTAACTSPICTLLSISMQIRDCPMPPPMVGAAALPTAFCGTAVRRGIRSLLWPAVLSAPFRPPDPHGGNLYRPVQSGYHTRISPLVTSRRSPAHVRHERLSGTQLVADLHQKYQSVFFAGGILPLLGSQIRIAVF